MQPGRVDADAECPASRRIADALTGSRATLQPASPPGGTWGCLSAASARCFEGLCCFNSPSELRRDSLTEVTSPVLVAVCALMCGNSSDTLRFGRDRRVVC